MTELSPIRRIAAGLVLLATVSPLGAATMPGDDDPLGASIQKVNSQCPPNYPTDVEPVPEAQQLGQMSEAQLLEMLGNWNPALRNAAARGLSSRGPEVIDTLTQKIESEDPVVRAGAATALAFVVQNEVGRWNEIYPDIADAQEAQVKIRARYAPLEPKLIALTTDSQREVRDAALNAIGSLRLDSIQAKRALLAMVNDPDVHLASAAIVQFQKTLTIEGLTTDELVAALKTAMRSPLPRGRGHAFEIIRQLDEETQKQFIGVLLDHLDWQPDRDTMFGAGAQQGAVELLTKFKVKELIPRLPALMTKTMRGPGLFEPCLQSIRAFGPDARIILPQLNERVQALELELASASDRSKPSIEKRIQLLREVIQHVQGE